MILGAPYDTCHMGILEGPFDTCHMIILEEKSFTFFVTCLLEKHSQMNDNLSDTWGVYRRPCPYLMVRLSLNAIHSSCQQTQAI